MEGEAPWPLGAFGGRAHVFDLQATVLNQLGPEHEGLTNLYAGRDFRLTDVHGNVVRDLLT